MHIILGHLFIILCVVVVLIYVAIPCLLLPLLQRIVAFFKRESYVDCKPFLWFLLPEKRKTILRLSLMITLFFFVVYGQQRFIWMGKDNANYTAKEYFVAGQPLNGVRQVLCKYLHPENPVLVPLTMLQKLIYNQGVKYLPENDGERGVWDDLWFYSCYINRMRKPYNTNSYKPSYEMRRLLDQMYESITIMATHPMADRQMEQEKGFFSFPWIVFYFVSNHGYYADKRFGSKKPMMQQEKYVQQKKQLYQWMFELREKWIAAGQYETIKQEKPKMEIVRQVLTILLGGDILYASIYTGDFNCGNPIIPDYLEARREFTDSNSPNYVWQSLYDQQREQAELYYGIGIDIYAASFHKYILEHYCDLEVPGEERYYGDIDKSFSKKQRIPTIKRVFHEERTLIEEGINE